MSNNTIVQFGMSRTGSTLIYRVLKEIFPNVEKCHLPEVGPYLGTDAKIVTTVRDPVDSFISHVRVVHYPDSIPSIILSQSYAGYINQRLYEHKQFNKILDENQDQILLLKYENFYNDFGYIFDKLENFFDIEIYEGKRVDIINKCGVEKAMEIQSTMTSFSEHDKETHIHGRHIVSPEPGSPSMFLKEKDVALLERLFKDEIDWCPNLK